MTIFWAVIILGVLCFFSLRFFWSMGGSMASQKIRDRMTEAGSDIQKKRLQEMGIEPEVKDE